MEISNNRQNVQQQSQSSRQLLPASFASVKVRRCRLLPVKAPPRCPSLKVRRRDKAIEELQAFVDGLGRKLEFRGMNRLIAQCDYG